MVEKDITEKEKENERKSINDIKKWVIVGAMITVLMASAMTYDRRASSSITLFFKDQNSSCHCPKVSQKYTGIIEDCCCDFETVDSINGEVLHPLLKELVTTPFFRYFKVKLGCHCPFWPEDGMCRLRDCSVCECPENEFPEPFKKNFHPALLSTDFMCQEGKSQASVDRTVDNGAFRGWVETDNPWTNDDETDNDDMTYVNLQINPERYTGYSGPSARRIWDAVYTENCPKYPAGEIFQEKKVLYKLISGLHSSISIHIGAEYLLHEVTNQWGENPELMNDRVLRYPDRVQNLYFTFLFVLRSVMKAANYLEHAEYNTDNNKEDMKSHSLVKQLVHNSKLQAACPLPFDEAKLWQGQSGPELKQTIQMQFKNISSLMDCVGCEKCRLWGKLQILGLGTALKILFSVDDKSNRSEPFQLHRNEVIALLNLLNRLSESVKLVHEKADMIENIVHTVEPASTKISTLQSINQIMRLGNSWT
ncbi:PREDICTED: endoplasmic reticulum oxidoreductin-1-like [Lupinus angustifolius]|uniref:endoplasmic reticulum oxidoreductin-1-like n=1 Tax=Lupinus angustifolius TaxID=3871 RepID=UPI00092EC7E0|nr:PREDICTED: endoplasmic reticulum oxidoreductin-1-like [Lupinus angustifolius]